MISKLRLEKNKIKQNNKKNKKFRKWVIIIIKIPLYKQIQNIKRNYSKKEVLKDYNHDYVDQKGNKKDYGPFTESLSHVTLNSHHQSVR